MNQTRWWMLAAVGVLAGCAKAPQEMDCLDAEVQKSARQLMALKVQNWQEPAYSDQSRRDQMLRQTSPEVAATLNGLRARSVSIEQVSLSEVSQLSAPKTPLESADAGLEKLPEVLRPKATGNKRLFSCKARVSVQLPLALSGIPAANQALLGVDGRGLNTEIIYETELTPDERLVVGVALANPLKEMAMGVALSSAVAAAASAASAAGTAP